eukprot:CAMPEP_0194139394 /NCGR_PEP_ID=MMETSP0152-20130528/9035_1 /TAXON_ID=1049557 /ORGANISM="Thalassiothrix antarctica, Strain L6-D1" /LENGTH=367 /DNA_ID=CAMNT_0038837193 /DNA_START=223 /DNA_END=1326 /DNA_ORIENTATION=+
MFSWSKQKGSRRPGIAGDYPGATTHRKAHTIQGSIRPPEFTREQHIDSYFQDAILKKSTRKVSVDDSTYDTVFQTTAGDALILRVYFPPPSSVRPPQMTLVGVKAVHNWLDRSTMRVTGYQSIQNDMAWKHARVLLGQAVREVVTHLQLNPPDIIDVVDPGLAKMQSNLRTGPMNNNTNNNPPAYNTCTTPPTPPPPVVNMPSIPSQFPDELEVKTRDELHEILNNELEFLKLLQSIPVHQEIQLQRDSILDENAKISTSLLERSEEYTLLHGRVTDLKESLSTKLQQFSEWQQQQDEFLKPPASSIVIKELNRVRKEAYRKSEQIAADWTDGNIEEFCKEFIPLRHTMHRRAAKVERLKFQHQQYY